MGAVAISAAATDANLQGRFRLSGHVTKSDFGKKYSGVRTYRFQCLDDNCDGATMWRAGAHGDSGRTTLRRTRPDHYRGREPHHPIKCPAGNAGKGEAVARHHFHITKSDEGEATVIRQRFKLKITGCGPDPLVQKARARGERRD